MIKKEDYNDKEETPKKYKLKHEIERKLNSSKLDHEVETHGDNIIEEKYEPEIQIKEPPNDKLEVKEESSNQEVDNSGINSDLKYSDNDEDDSKLVENSKIIKNADFLEELAQQDSDLEKENEFLRNIEKQEIPEEPEELEEADEDIKK